MGTQGGDLPVERGPLRQPGEHLGGLPSGEFRTREGEVEVLRRAGQDDGLVPDPVGRVRTCTGQPGNGSPGKQHGPPGAAALRDGDDAGHGHDGDSLPTDDGEFSWCSTHSTFVGMWGTLSLVTYANACFWYNRGHIRSPIVTPETRNSLPPSWPSCPQGALTPLGRGSPRSAGRSPRHSCG